MPATTPRLSNSHGQPPELAVIADRTCARFVRVVLRDDGERRLVRLEELEALVNPEAAMPDRDLFSTTKTGSRYSTRTRGGHVTSFDDHREHHRDANVAKFAKLIAAHTQGLLSGAGGLVLCAAPRMLGHLREAFASTPSETPRLEVPAHLTGLSLPELTTHLTEVGALPPSDPYAGR